MFNKLDKLLQSIKKYKTTIGAYPEFIEESDSPVTQWMAAAYLPHDVADPTVITASSHKSPTEAVERLIETLRARGL